MDIVSRIFVAGHRGLVGSAIVRQLRAQREAEVVLATREQLDLREQAAVLRFFERERPTQVYLAAAKVGGIFANATYPAEFLYDNLAIQSNVIDAAWRTGVSKLLFLGSSCIYPKMAEQPICEASLLTGSLEPTNEWYAVAKIAGIKMCQAYRAQYGFRAISLLPTNLYGPGDNFHGENSHVLPALLRRMHEAKAAGAREVTIWGSGRPRREFLHVDDLARAAVYLMTTYDGSEIVNVGMGADVAISELAEMVAEAVGYSGGLAYDASKPDGTPRKLLDVTRLHGLGWRATISLADGIRSTYEWFQANESRLRAS